jgi:ABC-type transport system involved in multi-copper enzyme maturation permease subunit
MIERKADRTPSGFYHEMRAHLWKDLKVIRSSSFMFILLAVVIGFSCIFAYSVSLEYSIEVSDIEDELTLERMSRLQNMAIFDYWKGLAILWPLAFGIMGTLMVSQENEDGLIKYIFSYGSRAVPVYLGKLISLLALALLVLFVSMALFEGIFYAVSGETIDFLVLLEASVHPFVGLIIIALIGLLVASLIKKRYTSLVLILAFVFIVSAISNVARSDGLDMVTENGFQELGDFPLTDKVLVILDPMILKEGMLDSLGFHNDNDSFAFDYYRVLTPESRSMYALFSILIISMVNVWILRRSQRDTSLKG